MTPSGSLQIPLAPALVVSPAGSPVVADRAPVAGNEDRDSRLARGEATDARWFVRVVLTTGTDGSVRSVRAIINDRDIQRILLHTAWANWRDMPLLATLLATISQSAATPETMAADLATALVASLAYNADACLEQLGMPIGSLPTQAPGPQERAARRNAHDAAMP